MLLHCYWALEMCVWFGFLTLGSPEALLRQLTVTAIFSCGTSEFAKALRSPRCPVSDTAVKGKRWGKARDEHVLFPVLGGDTSSSWHTLCSVYSQHRWHWLHKCLFCLLQPSKLIEVRPSGRLRKKSGERKQLEKNVIYTEVQVLWSYLFPVVVAVQFWDLSNISYVSNCLILGS